MHDKLDKLGEYCVYLRKSRADRDAELKGDEDTLARHKKILEDLAAKMCISIKKYYAEVVSGDTISERPVMQELLRDVDNGMWDGVLVVEVQRLARGNTRDQGIVAESFKYSNTLIITPEKIYNPNDEFDEEYFEFGLFMSRREYKAINRRLHRGRIASVKEGNFIASTAPYGYRRVKIKGDKGYTLEINEEEAKVVRMIFEWYCSGIPQENGTTLKLGADSIARRLDSLGIFPRTSRHWSRATINDMLKNPVYYGDVRFGYRQCIKQMQDNHVVVTRKESDNCQQNSGKHEPIITYEMFLKAQEIRLKNKKNTVPSSCSLQNPLSGLIYCKKCGSLMTRLAPNSRNKYATLKCPNRYCTNVSSPLFLVEQQILDFLRDWLVDYEVNPNALDYNTPVEKEMELLQNTIKINNAELVKLQAQLNKAYTLLEQDVYTVDIFRERQKSLNKEIEQLIEALKKYEEEFSRLENLKYSNEQFIPHIKNLLEVYGSSPPAVKNQFMKEVIARVEYLKEQPNTRGKLYNSNFSLEIYPKLPHS